MDHSPQDDGSMSVIPYDTHRDVVLRNADSVVYYDQESRQLILRNRSRRIEARSPTRTECPTCGRPWLQEDSVAAQATAAAASDEQPSYITHDYFRMLARSLPGSNESSTPSSPRRRTIQPARSRLASPPIVPPPDAELISTEPAPPSPSQGISETAFSPQYFQKFFVIEKELGRGGRGVVLLVKHILDGVTLGRFACKRVPIGDDHAWLEKVLVEVQALQTLTHQNLVSYRHVWLQDYQINNFGPSVPCAFILQQFCNGGDLHNYVCGSAKVQTTAEELKERIRRRSKGDPELPRQLNEPKRLHFDEIYSFFRDITAGLRFLHLNGFIHRDLKPSNCLLHTVGGEMRVLVSDFGEVQYENAVRKSTGATGTISYCAPEVLQRETPNGPLGNFTFKSDIFSLGMILHFLCFANLPYNAADVLHEEQEDLTELRAEIMSWAGFDEHRRERSDLPSKLYSFLKRLLSLTPDNRPSADEVDKGIRLGGLDQVPDTRRRQSMSPEDLTPGRRIQKLESPAPSHLRRRKTSAELQGLGLISKNESRESPFPDNDDISDGQSTPGSVAMQRTTSAPVRSKTTSPSKSPSSLPSTSQALIPKSPTSPKPQSASLLPLTDRSPRLLLPPPPISPLRSSHLSSLLFTAQPLPTPLRITILAIKLVTALQPCMMRSTPMNPFIVYPVLAAAVLELSLKRVTWLRAGLFMLVHLGVLGYAVWSGMLCGWGYSREMEMGGMGGDVWRERIRFGGRSDGLGQ